MYKKKNSDKVRIIQSKEEWMRVLQMCYSDPTMLHTLRPRMTMTKVRVQQQVGGPDCGLFAIAFAMAFVNGQDPAALPFDQGVVRKHLRLCLQRK